jgi:hypothetical protein
MVPVPHPSQIVDGRWVHPYYELVVACGCKLGAIRFNLVMAAKPTRAYSGHRTEVRMIDMAEYEALHPDWRELAAAVQETKEAESAARACAAEADKRSPVQAVARRIGKSVEERAI